MDTKTAAKPATNTKPANASGGPVATTKPNTPVADNKPAESAPVAAAATPAGDRGDVGTVQIRKSTREITSVRTRTSTDPIHVAVKDAVKGEWYDIEVDDDATKIDRVARKLRAAAQKFDVGMNIHPDTIPATDEQNNKIAGKVIVSFRTGDRDKRAKSTGGEGGAVKTAESTDSAKN